MDKPTIGHYASHQRDVTSQEDAALNAALRSSTVKVEHPEIARLRAEREEYRRLLVEARESVALELGNMNVRLQRSMSSASLHERDEVAGLLSAIDAAIAAKEE